jgi:hypothetical protein
VFLQYHGTATPLLQGGDHIRFRTDGIIKLGGIAANTKVGMGIAASRGRQAQRLTGVYGKAVFAIRTGPVTDFYAIDQIKHRPLDGCLQGQRCRFLPGLEVGSKGTPEWMRHDHGPSGIVHYPSELLGLPNARDILLESVHEDVSEIGAHLHTAQEQKIVLGSQVAHLETIPALIVLSDHDPIQTKSFGFSNEFNRVQVAISRIPTRMDMQIEYHREVPLRQTESIIVKSAKHNAEI